MLWRHICGSILFDFGTIWLCQLCELLFGPPQLGMKRGSPRTLSERTPLDCIFLLLLGRSIERGSLLSDFWNATLTSLQLSLGQICKRRKFLQTLLASLIASTYPLNASQTLQNQNCTMGITMIRLLIMFCVSDWQTYLRYRYCKETDQYCSEEQWNVLVMCELRVSMIRLTYFVTVSM